MKDKWEYYIKGNPVPIAEATNLYQHWSEQRHSSTIQQMVYNHFSIPAMSAECNRNRLKEDIIEVTECIVQWIRADYCYE